MKVPSLFILLISSSALFAQQPNYEQIRFCKNLNKVFEDGRKENFESLSIGAGGETHNALVKVPGYSVNLNPFDIYYVDKDNRFVAKTNENMDSLAALRKLEEYKAFIGYCLDSTWKWSEVTGDDSSTVFFHEIKELKAVCPDLHIIIAMDLTVPRLYQVNLYIRRNKQRNR